ncbi:hypothetical protein D3C84_1228620 [compost metagenome]
MAFPSCASMKDVAFVGAIFKYVMKTVRALRYMDISIASSSERGNSRIGLGTCRVFNVGMYRVLFSSGC